MLHNALHDLAQEAQAEEGIDASNPLEWYWKFSQRGDFEADPAQIAVVQQLERLHDELEKYRQYRQGTVNRIVTNLGRGERPPRGLYVWGSVGRGKSLMMDAFYKVSTLKRKRRVHFHEFMREIHTEMRKLSGEEDPLKIIAAQIARQLRLLCFDEFHVSDIADAMILGRLLELLTSKGVVMVITSNYPPDDLYANGLQRARFLPAIEILKRELDVVEIAGGRDHRRRILESIPVYLQPLNDENEQALAAAFDAMSRASHQVNGAIPVGNQTLHFIRRAKGVVWFAFEELCVKPRSQLDFLGLARHYHTVLISGIPQLHAKNRADVVRRFTWLVDIFYDQHVKLICSAATDPESLVIDDKPAHATAAAVKATDSGDVTQFVSAEFARTASRLREMQSRDYFSRKHVFAESAAAAAETVAVV